MANVLLKTLFLLGFLFSTSSAFANICGTDFQNFNPSTGGLDFVTVQSSETLKPCILNMGLFLNYAANSLTYSQAVNGEDLGGQKRNDRILAADMSVGMGITERWDAGLNMPAILNQSMEDDAYAASFDRGGVTELKANTKFRFLGDDRGGLAGVASFNYNLIEDNPFSGSDPGLTWNFELAADTILAKKWALGVNAGYRLRNQGDPIPNVPFVPMDDQYTYSIATSYLVASLDTKVIFELYGSQAAKEVSRDTERALSSLEALLGVKHDYSQNLAVHLGFTKQVDAALGGADWRVYAGVNFAVGPLCKAEPAVVEKISPPVEVVDTASLEPEVFNLNVDLLFKLNSDRIDDEQLGPLDAFLQSLIAQGYEKVVVEGHTDSMGAADYNMDLSLRRANRVRDYMLEKFKMDSSRTTSEGFGLTRPIADNGNYQGRQQNRRVEFKVWRHK